MKTQKIKEPTKPFTTWEEFEYAGGWVEGICAKDIRDCPHLFICLCEEEEYYKKNKLEQDRRNKKYFPQFEGPTK